MCDTKYFTAALDEAVALWKKNNPHEPPLRVGDMHMSLLSTILKRAQSLKDADAAARAEERGRQPRSAVHGIEEGL